MSKKYSVLIIDDHPIICDAYKNVLNQLSVEHREFEFDIDMANNCDDAYKKIQEISKNTGVDLIFLDIRLPPSKDGRILSGEDLGIKIRELIPNSKIIVSTTYNDNYRLHNIFKSIDPDGFIIKNDVTPKKLIKGIITVINEPPFYSKTVIELLRKHVSSDIVIDKLDRRILYELSLGAKMKDLPNLLPLSLTGIERRKRQLKEIFNVKKLDDRHLIRVAKEKGFL